MDCTPSDERLRKDDVLRMARDVYAQVITQVILTVKGLPTDVATLAQMSIRAAEIYYDAQIAYVNDDNGNTLLDEIVSNDAEVKE
jgi:hypothetical protein